MRKVKRNRDKSGRFIKGHTYSHTLSAKKKIGLAHKGKKLSKEHRRKLSDIKKGKRLSEEHKLRIKKAMEKNPPNKGRVFSKEWKENIGKSGIGREGYWKGKKFTKKHRQKLSQAFKGRKPLKGKDHPHWRGGLTDKNKRIRNSVEFKEWRERVFKRDNWTCQECEDRGGKLHPHHIKPFSKYPKLRFAVSNGITFCEECHHQTDSWGVNL